jgi:hypothetical protein
VTELVRDPHVAAYLTARGILLADFDYGDYVLWCRYEAPTAPATQPTPKWALERRTVYACRHCKSLTARDVNAPTAQYCRVCRRYDSGANVHDVFQLLAKQVAWLGDANVNAILDRTYANKPD